MNDGPVLDGVYPSLLLLPAEAQNMSVDSYILNASLIFLLLTAPSVHFRILYNSTKGQRPTLFEYESNSKPIHLTIDPSIKMVLYTGFLISFNAGIHPRNEVTIR